MARRRFPSRGGTSSNAPHRGAHGCQPHHHAAGRVRRPPRNGNAQFLRTDVPRANAPPVPGLAGRDAFRRCLCRMSHRRGGSGTRAREAFRRATADDGRRQYVSNADCAGRKDGSRRPGGTVQGMSPARTRDRRSRPCPPRVCRRRSQHRDDDRAADAHERHDVIGACDSLACGSFCSRRVRGDGCGAADDPVRARDRREGPGQRVHRDGYEGGGDSQRRTPYHGLHRLPQHGRASRSRRHRSRRSIGRSRLRW